MIVEKINIIVTKIHKRDKFVVHFYLNQNNNKWIHFIFNVRYVINVTVNVLKRADPYPYSMYVCIFVLLFA